MKKKMKDSLLLLTLQIQLKMLTYQNSQHSIKLNFALLQLLQIPILRQGEQVTCILFPFITSIISFFIRQRVKKESVNLVPFDAVIFDYSSASGVIASFILIISSMLFIFIN